MIRIITGPTGSGKSSLAEKFAKKEGLGIINCDAFQFYKEIPILTNQARADGIEYKFLGDRSIKDLLNAGEFSRIMSTCIESPNIWVGTGLYLGAALYGLDGDGAKPIEGVDNGDGAKRTPFQGAPKAPYKMIVLDPEREKLYDSLNKRVDEMIEKGALEEAKAVRKMVTESKISADNVVLKAIGLQHLLQYLDESLAWDRVVELWKRDTRRLAKRQWTWLRKFCEPSDSVVWIKPEKSDIDSLW